MKNIVLALLVAAIGFPSLVRAEEELPLPPPVNQGPAPAPKSAAGKDKLWFRDAGEYLSSRSIRMGVATEANTKMITDGKRFDLSLGKRISLINWGEASPSETWAVGIDGGMLASLTRYKKNGQLTFATNTFDGFFGAYVGYIGGGWLALLRYAHLSAHLVDSNPNILNALNYSQFWGEAVVGKTFPAPEEESNWELHLQGSAGMNHTSSPKAKQPRATFGTTLSVAPGGPDTMAIIGSADMLNAGVIGQRPSYAFFTGIGSLNRPNLTTRPWRLGVGHFTGSDYRNQYYSKRQKWTTFELATEF